MNKNAPRTNQRQARRAAILEAVRREPIPTQQDLVAALQRRGISTTQASLSRDIARLGLLKVGGRYQSAPATARSDADVEQPLRAYLRSASVAGGGLVVLRCLAGTAPQVALALDRIGRSEVVGTVAGDDTVFVAVASKNDAESLAHYLEAKAAQAPAAHG